MDPIIPQSETVLTPEPKHFLNKKFAITFVILLLLGTGAYAGIWWWGKQITLQTQPSIFSGCEEKVGDSYQNTVPAKIELLGSNYVLTLRCKNADSSIYISEPNGLSKYLNTSVAVKYQYVDYISQVQCVRAPCPPVTETRVKIISINETGDQGQTACTQEAKQCPDGSYIGRTGPNCEFAACPGEGILIGHVTIGPNCPVEQADNPCAPSPQAYTSRQVSVYKADGTTLVTTQNFDTQGDYNIALPAGTYVVKSKTGIGSIASVVGTVIIKNGQTSTLNFSIDTGIR